MTPRERKYFLRKRLRKHRGIKMGPTLFHGFMFFDQHGRRTGETLVKEPINLSQE